MPPGVGNAEPVVPLYAKVVVASLDYTQTTLQANVFLLDGIVLEPFLCCSIGDDAPCGHNIVCLLQPYSSWDEIQTVFRLITEYWFP